MVCTPLTASHQPINEHLLSPPVQNILNISPIEAATEAPNATHNADEYIVGVLCLIEITRAPLSEWHIIFIGSQINYTE